MIFVTGGTGLLGSHLLVELAQNNKAIRAIYRCEKKKESVRSLFKYYIAKDYNLFFDRIEWIKSDILDIIDLRDAMEGAKQIYHCAGLVSFHKSDFNKLLKINYEGTSNIVNLALEIKNCKLCYVSSTAAVGGGNNEYINEKSKWKNTPKTSGYSISKYSAEREVWRAIQEGLNAVIVNPCVIIGAGNWKLSSLKIFNTLKKGSWFYPPGSNAIVDARDVSEIMIKLMNSDIKSERFLCIGSNQSFKKLMFEIAQKLGVNPPKKAVSRYIVEVTRVIIGLFSMLKGGENPMTSDTINSLFDHKSYDASKIKNLLNYKFRDLSEAIENSIRGQQH